MVLKLSVTLHLFSMWEHFQPLRVDHNTTSERFIIPMEGHIISKDISLESLGKFAFVYHISTSFASKSLANPERIPPSTNPSTPSFTLQWDLTILSCCQSWFMWGMVVSPSHSPIGLQFSTGMETTWLQANMCGYRVSCELNGSQNMKMQNILPALKVEKISFSLAVLTVKWSCRVSHHGACFGCCTQGCWCRTFCGLLGP